MIPCKDTEQTIPKHPMVLPIPNNNNKIYVIISIIIYIITMNGSFFIQAN